MGPQAQLNGCRGEGGGQKLLFGSESMATTSHTHPPGVPQGQTCLQRHMVLRLPGPSPGWQTRPWFGSQTWRWSQGSPSRRAQTWQQPQPSSTRGTPGGHRGGGQGQAHGVGHSWAHTCRDRDLTQLQDFEVGGETLPTLPG